jgi:hypothetical protein
MYDKRFKKSRALLVAMLVLTLSTVALSTSAQGYEGATWSIGETELETNHVLKAKSVGGIKLEDKGSYIVNCNLTGESKIGLYGKGEITTASPAECKSSSGCTGTITVKVVHLPWNTQLEEPTETSLRSLLSSSGAGLPGWSLECTIGEKIKDECTGETTASLENVKGGTNLTFDAKSAALKCTRGGAGTGVIKGTILDENTTGQVAGNDRVDNLVGTVLLGPTSPLIFASSPSAQAVILHNRGTIRRVYQNGGMDTPGEVNVNSANFRIGALLANPCGTALAGGAQCEITISSTRANETGEYTFKYGSAGSPLTNTFQLKS